VRKKIFKYGIRKIPKQIEKLPWFSFLLCFPVLFCFSNGYSFEKGYLNFVIIVAIMVLVWFILIIAIDCFIILIHCFIMIIYKYIYQNEIRSDENKGSEDHVCPKDLK
jgi:hypothetical protein